jgi:inosose dehydratase
MAIKIGYQTLAWTATYGEQNLPETLREISQVGFRGVEVCEPLSAVGSVDEFQMLLDTLGLQLVSVSSGVSGDPGKQDEIEDVHRRIDFAAQFGVYVIMVCGGFGVEGVKDKTAAMRGLAAIVEQIVPYAGKHGMDVAFHNHIGTLVETRDDMDRFFEMAPNTKVCLDTGHLAAAGGDTLKTIEDYGRRIAYAHLKDFDSSIKKPADEDYYRGFVELGAGNVGLDFANVLDAMDRHALAEWAVVELDRPRGTPIEAAKKSFDHLRSLNRI